MKKVSKIMVKFRKALTKRVRCRILSDMIVSYTNCRKRLLQGQQAWQARYVVHFMNGEYWVCTMHHVNQWVYSRAARFFDQFTRHLFLES